MKKDKLNSENIGWGVTRHYGRLITDGDKRAVQIQTNLRDEKRLQVFLSKSMNATLQVELDVEAMTDEDVSKYLGIQSRCYDKFHASSKSK